MPRRKISKKKSDNPEKEMRLSDHLRELRNRAAVCIILLLAAAVAGINFAPKIVDLLLDIGRQYNYEFVYIAPQELLMQYFSVALIMALCVTLPMLLYQIWAFIQPGLKKNENTIFLLAMAFGLVCFCIGVLFAYKLMLPFMLQFFISLSVGSTITASISVANYVTFLMTIFVIFGIVFELPVVSVTLTQLGLLKVEWMKKGRRVVIVIIFIVAAIITPPDVVSQVMVALPMMLLYELSIRLAGAAQKLKRKKKEEQEAEEDDEDDDDDEDEKEEKPALESAKKDD